MAFYTALGCIGWLFLPLYLLTTIKPINNDKELTLYQWQQEMKKLEIFKDNKF